MSVFPASSSYTVLKKILMLICAFLTIGFPFSGYGKSNREMNCTDEVENQVGFHRNRHAILKLDKAKKPLPTVYRFYTLSESIDNVIGRICFWARESIPLAPPPAKLVSKIQNWERTGYINHPENVVNRLKYKFLKLGGSAKALYGKDYKNMIKEVEELGKVMKKIDDLDANKSMSHSRYKRKMNRLKGEVVAIAQRIANYSEGIELLRGTSKSSIKGLDAAIASNPGEPAKDTIRSFCALKGFAIFASKLNIQISPDKNETIVRIVGPTDSGGSAAANSSGRGE